MKLPAKLTALACTAALASTALGGCVVAANDPVDGQQVREAVEGVRDGLRNGGDDLAQAIENAGEALSDVPNWMAAGIQDKLERVDVAHADGSTTTLEGKDARAFVASLDIGSWTYDGSVDTAGAEPSSTAAVWQNGTVKLGQEESEVEPAQVATLKCYPDERVVSVEISVLKDGGVWLFGDLGIDLSSEAERLLTFRVPDRAVEVFENAG